MYLLVSMEESLQQYDKIPQEEIKRLQFALDKCLPELLKKEFGHKVTFINGMYSGKCIIHGGDRNDNFSLYNNQGTIKWQCFSKHCHDVYKNSSIGLIRGLLSKKEGVSVSFGKTIQFLKEKLGEGANEPIPELPKQDENIVLGDISISRAEVRKRLRIPSPYFINRGFSPEILDFYDVGPSIFPVKKTYFREIVPIYEPTNQFCIGCSARSIFDICQFCNCYHSPESKCPAVSYARLYSKWKNLNFKMRYSLYNYWNLPPKLSSLIIVEGPGNVWKLVEAGIKNVVGLYSAAKINEYKEKLIKDKGVDTLWLGFDNDEAGEYAFQENGKKFWDKFHIHKLSPLNNDFGDMTVKEIQNYVFPQMGL